MRSPETLAVAFPSSVPARLTGRLELQLQSILSARLTRPERVTGVLDCVFDYVGGTAATPELIRRLATGAREWLLQRAGGLFLRDRGWFEASCQECGQSFDLPLSLADAPRSPAGRGYPTAQIETSLGLRTFEVPNGLHEEKLARSEGGDPSRQLLGLCGLSDHAFQEALQFSAVDVEQIDAGLDAIAPDVASELNTQCPSCQANTSAVIDPLEFSFPEPASLIRETHAIASAYGWEEATIMTLPSQRRRQYANLIAADMRRGRGMR
ncbi:MAG: hypothetical protein GY952_07410 [Rhodobacteraceae bacterium]|nr:hypothetical protein [Paracoccaceae bacterium]